MKRLSFIPEIFIWLTFSVVAGFGYAFSFFRYVDHYTSVSMMDTIIPTLVWMLLAAICTFLLKVAQNTQCFVKFSKAEAVFLECSILALLFIGGWVFRFVDYFHVVWPLELDNEFFRAAQVSQEMTTYMNPHPASRLYVGFLRIVCMFLGNIYEAGAFIQFLLLMVSVLIWYAAIRKAFDVTAALFFAAGAMLLPDSIISSMQCDPTMLLFAIYGGIVWLAVEYAKSSISGICAFLAEFILVIFISFAVFLDISGVLLIAVYFLSAYERIKRFGKGRCQIFFAFNLGAFAGIAFIVYLQTCIYGMSYYDSLCFQGYSNINFYIPDIENLKIFLFSLGTHPILIVAIVIISIYWLLNKKLVFTWFMLAVLYLFSLKLFGLDTYLQHDFMIYMAISTLLGISVKQYLMLTDKKQFDHLEADTTEESDFGNTQEEPVVTIVNFEEEHQTVVPEKPLIFIPKSMEIPKRVSKPKIDFAVNVNEENMHFDYSVEDEADFDLK